MGVVEYLGLAVAAFAAGAINAVAGGGSLVSFPALLFAGFAAKTANVTNTVALWPGYAGGSYGYRPELSRQRQRFLRLAAPAIVGSLVGSVVLLATPASAFNAIVPFLILFACTMMAFQDQLSRWAQAHRLASRGEEHVPFALLVSTFTFAIYGAYFGAALGIITLAFLAILLPDDIQHSNALKGLLSLLINAVAVVYFAFFGPVRWLPAAIMAVGAVAGGYLGVGVARRLGRRWLRIVVIAYGAVVAVILLVQLFV